MERRDFIKNSLCLGCVGFLASGCKNILVDDDLKNDKFYYKSKEDLPKRIHLEACSLCQLSCPGCDARKLEKNMPKDWVGYLKFNDFKNLVDDNNFKKIELANKGEIFLNPELDEIIKYAYEKGVDLTATIGVNFNDVSETTIENLVKYQFKAITVSIDGATPETYKIYRRGGDFNKVIDNIKKINYFKKKYNSEYPHLFWQFILFGHNEHEIELAKKKAKELNMDILFKINSLAVGYSPVKDVKTVEKLTGVKLFKNSNDYIKDKSKKHQLYACNMLFNSPLIDYNGDLLGCCRVSTKKFRANVFKDGLLNALNSKDFIYAKKMLTDASVTPMDDIPCAKCSRYEFLRKTKEPYSFRITTRQK